MKDFCDTYALENIVKGPTCFKNPLNPSSIDLMLTNKPRSFQNSTKIESGLSDHHIMAISVMKSFFPKQTPTLIKYRSYRRFNPDHFGNELQSNLESLNKNAKYKDFESIFIETLNKHAPMKDKFVRANNAPFMNKILSKAIMKRSRLKNTFLRNPDNNNKVKYKKQRNYCVNLVKRKKKEVL